MKVCHGHRVSQILRSRTFMGGLTCLAVVVAVLVLVAWPDGEPTAAGDALAASTNPDLDFAAVNSAVKPGGLVSFKVANGTDSLVSFGLGGEVQHREKGRWVDVTRDVLGDQLIFAILLFAEPGETVGPKYDADVYDGLKLPHSIPPGPYRLTREFQIKKQGKTDERAYFRVR